METWILRTYNNTSGFLSQKIIIKNMPSKSRALKEAELFIKDYKHWTLTKR